MAKHKRIAPAGRAASAPETKPTSRPTVSGIQKEFPKTHPICRVTFTLPKEAAFKAKTVCIVGEFNDWSRDATPMERRENGDFSISLDLEKGRSYRFRYLVDGCKFENDWDADRYEANPYGGEDSVVEV